MRTVVPLTYAETQLFQQSLSQVVKLIFFLCITNAISRFRSNTDMDNKPILKQIQCCDDEAV